MVESPKRWRDSPLFTRLAWGFGLAFLALHLLYIGHGARERLLSNAEVFALSTIERAQTLAEVAQSDPALLTRLSTRDLRVSFSTTAPRPDRADWEHGDEVAAAARAILSGRGEPPPIEQIWFEEPVRGRDGRLGPRLVIVLTQPEGFLKVEADMRSGSWRNPSAGVLWTTLLALLIFGALLWGTRRVTRYLPAFSDAAERLGRGESTAPLPLEGPREVRRAARAFNEMQRRVADHVQERTTMMAAFSHDLRTLATRLALRVEALPEHDQRDQVLAEVDAMTGILEEAVAFARDEASEEPFVSLDLASLLQTQLDEAADAAMLMQPPRALRSSLSFADEGQAEPYPLSAQPLALQRALANLIDNAVRYGGDVWAMLARAESPAGTAGYRVLICDPGPGIPEADRARVMKAYVRLEESRNRGSGGTGLGLAIVSNVVRRHGGTLRFGPSEELCPEQVAGSKPGFCAELWLPLARGAENLL